MSRPPWTPEQGMPLATHHGSGQQTRQMPSNPPYRPSCYPHLLLGHFARHTGDTNASTQLLQPPRHISPSNAPNIPISVSAPVLGTCAHPLLAAFAAFAAAFLLQSTVGPAYRRLFLPIVFLQIWAHSGSAATPSASCSTTCSHHCLH